MAAGEEIKVHRTLDGSIVIKVIIFLNKIKYKLEISFPIPFVNTRLPISYLLCHISQLQFALTIKVKLKQWVYNF